MLAGEKTIGYVVKEILSDKGKGFKNRKFSMSNCKAVSTLILKENDVEEVCPILQQLL